MSDLLWQPSFNCLAPEHKRKLMERIAKHYHLEFLGLQTFERYGLATTTGYFRKKNLDLVFVPGAHITLGWENFLTELNAAGKAELEEIYEEWGEYPDIGASMAPVHKTSIGPMVVAVNLQEVGYEAIELTDKRLRLHERKLFKDYIAQDGLELTIARRARLSKEGDHYQAYLYHQTSYLELKEKLAAQDLALPTADEWAYLCGGGCRTLFPWGEGIDESMKLYHFAESDDPRPYDLAEPNFFGLVIGYDPYKRELVEDATLTTIGGDGGCNICGGLGLLLGYLPCSPHNAPQKHSSDIINNDYDFYRPLIRVALAMED